MAREILTTYGYNVHTAKSGGEAIEMVKHHKYDLLLLDMIMDNGFDGLDTYIRVKKIQKDQKAIVISGYSSTDRVDMLLKLGAGCYLKKPYTSKQLAEAVRKELDKAISEKTHFAPFLPPTDLLRSSEPVT
jgi:two-component system cell cycle sensor histidine kinase/response regulator CckA